MTELIAAFPDRVFSMQDAIHGRDRAVILTLIKQSGPDLAGRVVAKARRGEQIQHGLALGQGQGASRWAPL
jgi:hypothetical protein